MTTKTKELKISDFRTICAYCGRRYGHTKICPIYIGSFPNGQVPNTWVKPEKT